MAEFSTTFSIGTKVEVNITDDEGFAGSWYQGTIVCMLEPGLCIVEYSRLVEYIGGPFVREEVAIASLRPPPREIVIINRLEVGDYVDANLRDGWWEGQIKEVLPYGTYVVYFETNAEEKMVNHRKLRIRQEWKYGVWRTVPKASTQVTNKELTKMSIKTEPGVIRPVLKIHLKLKDGVWRSIQKA